MTKEAYWTTKEGQRPKSREEENPKSLLVVVVLLGGGVARTIEAIGASPRCLLVPQ